MQFAGMTVLPPFLQAGDTIALIGPAFVGKPVEMESGMQFLQNQGFVLEGYGLAPKTAWGKFTATDAERQAELQWALDHRHAKAIICLRGGYGVGRILPALDWTRFREQPKWLVGFSDITLLHQAINQQGIASVQGPMLVHYGRDSQMKACGAELDILSGRQRQIHYPLQAERPGKSSGLLRGGNLSMLAHLCGQIPRGSFAGSVLLLEEIGEAHYRIDRMLWQLKNAGLMEGIAGLVLGQFTDCEPDGFPLTVPEMVLEKLDASVPVFSGLEHGHDAPCLPVLSGWEVMLSAEEGFRQRVPLVV